MTNELDAERLRELLSYNTETGVFTWRVSTNNRIRVGQVAGVLHDGYVRVAVAKHRHLAHVLAWLHHYGRWPADQIDHINGDPSDNRIANLRECSHAQNAQNRKRRIDNASGFKGVHGCRQGWRATLRRGGRLMHLGYFKTPEAAHDAYLAAAEQHFGEFARGQ
jgi:hypothetical protein